MPLEPSQFNQSIDLNCDLGEYESVQDGDSDAHIMPFISSCNIACAAHAGNTAVIDQTITCALKHQVNIGAHPSYPDRAHFGRHVMKISEADLKSSLKQQILLVQTAAKKQHANLKHVKPHGALYNQAANDFNLAILIAETILEIDSDLKLYGLAHSHVETAAEKVGLSFVAEGFADRAYTAGRTLVPRDQEGACIANPKKQIEQVLSLLSDGCIKTLTGEVVSLKVDTLSLHGDHPHAVQTAKYLSQTINEAGFQIKAP